MSLLSCVFTWLTRREETPFPFVSPQAQRVPDEPIFLPQFLLVEPHMGIRIKLSLHA